MFNNCILGFVAMEMKVAGIPLYGTDMKNPDFAKMANVMGILGIRVEDPTEVCPAIEQALNHDGPVVVDVLTNPSELSLPPKIELNQAWGFSVYMLKETLSGHGDEVVQTIESNFLKKLKKPESYAD
ncbi:MAG: thiamine pyrophosphate-dependent enzyme [Rhizonema sp. PD38]|nr:thiamine pyrophosphate-dependent enzyme [Rhizonema sp. PD38]